MTYACAAFSTQMTMGIFTQNFWLCLQPQLQSQLQSQPQLQLPFQFQPAASWCCWSATRALATTHWTQTQTYSVYMWYVAVSVCGHVSAFRCLVSIRTIVRLSIGLRLCPGKVAIDVPPITSACSTFAPQATRWFSSKRVRGESKRDLLLLVHCQRELIKFVSISAQFSKRFLHFRVD